MNADKWLWPTFGSKVGQSVQIGMKLELAVFEIALGTLLDIRSTNELTFGGPTLILADQRNMSYQK